VHREGMEFIWPLILLFGQENQLKICSLHYNYSFFKKKTLKQNLLLKLDTIHSTVNTFLHLMFASIYMVGCTFVCMMHVIVYTRFLREFCQWIPHQIYI
jgi:hypothetical protein